MAKRKEYTDAELKEIAVKKARNIWNEPIEHAFCIDCEANIQPSRIGTDGSVYVSEIQAKTARYVVHNHPHPCKEPSTFSGADVYALLHFRLNEIIVCSYGTIFSMSNNGCKLPASEVEKQMDSEFRKIDHKYQKKYLNEAASASDSKLKAAYKAYLISIEQEYRIWLKNYALENNLIYMEVE
ncbi:MAG TPA: hypothetical protein O0X70_04270 [Methanocorpusculum sp.]|nr:hypothetical protein [Methanocorpusculum sp.]